MTEKQKTIDEFFITADELIERLDCEWDEPTTIEMIDDEF